MIINPYQEKYTKLQREIADLRKREVQISKDILWFDGLDISRIQFEISNIKTDGSRLTNLLRVMAIELEALKKELAQLNSKVGTPFNPLNWFDDQQKIYKARIQILEAQKLVKQTGLDQTRKTLSELAKSIEDKNKLVSRYESYDRVKIGQELREINDSLVLKEKECEIILPIKNKIDAELSPLNEQIESYESRIRWNNEVLGDAIRFERELSEALNGYERKRVHDACLHKYDEGKPRNLIKSSEKVLRQLEKDLIKTQDRARKKLQSLMRVIDTIVVDGNNLCYEDSRFIGINAIRSLTEKLSDQYKFIVVFDSGIRGLMRASDDDIRSDLPDCKTVHVVASKTAADQTILEIACDNEGIYILSNDRFGEYSDKEVVKAHRLIKHEMVNGIIMIHDLNFKARY